MKNNQTILAITQSIHISYALEQIFYLFCDEENVAIIKINITEI